MDFSLTLRNTFFQPQDCRKVIFVWASISHFGVPIIRTFKMITFTHTRVHWKHSVKALCWKLTSPGPTLHYIKQQRDSILLKLAQHGVERQLSGIFIIPIHSLEGEVRKLVHLNESLRSIFPAAVGSLVVRHQFHLYVTWKGRFGNGVSLHVPLKG